MVNENWTLEYDPVQQTLFELKKENTVIWTSGTLKKKHFI